MLQKVRVEDENSIKISFAAHTRSQNGVCRQNGFVRDVIMVKDYLAFSCKGKDSPALKTNKQTKLLNPRENLFLTTTEMQRHLV